LQQKIVILVSHVKIKPRNHVGFKAGLQVITPKADRAAKNHFLRAANGSVRIGLKRLQHAENRLNTLSFTASHAVNRGSIPLGVTIDISGT